MSVRDEQKIITALRQLAEGKYKTIPAFVINNYPDHDYIDVEAVDGTQYDFVRKRAAVDDKPGLVITPKVNSSILMVRIHNSDQFFMAMASEIESVRLEINGTTINADKDKIDLKVEDFGIEISKDLVKFNDGSFEGFVKVKELTDKLNAIEKAFNDHIKEYNAHIHSGGTINGFTDIPKPISTLNLQSTQQSDIENDKITHGI